MNARASEIRHTENKPSLVLSILEATFTVSPNKQYLGILIPMTPATQGPK